MIADLSIVMGIAIGFSIGGFMVLGFEAMRKRRKRKQDIERAGELAEKYPVLAQPVQLNPGVDITATVKGVDE